MNTFRLLVALGLLLCVSLAQEKEEEPSKSKDPMHSATFSGLKFRSIGPALTSGRVGDFAVDPNNRSRYYVAVSSGGVWKTTNAGTSWIPVFDGESSFSIGCLAMDPKNPAVVWVGTGENASQRSVSWGDGVYRTEDGGKSWQNMGLRKSEHIGKILIDPRNSDVAYAACEGPLWAPGGDRGLYKTTDGGRSWTAVLTVSKNTGVTDVVMDPRNPDLLYAASYQRRRHVWTLIDGGPESAIYRSQDAGKTWKKLTSGLPSEEMGHIGLAVSPVNPDIVYATIEATMGKGGFYRSSDRGSTWERRSDVVAGSPQYYQEIFCDPKAIDRVYLMDVYIKVTDDGGRTFRNLGEKNKHVDSHALWIDPDDTDYLLVGCDGGIYESFDRAATWSFKANLPVTQFYRVHVDNAKPFYNVLGGTQDNFSLSGPSRTISATGIQNADWVVTNGGDGFESASDPENPNILYAQAQHGGLVRYDRKTGEMIDIKPKEGKGDPPLRWNWDSPLIVSPHAPTRLYFAANILFRSDDRGDSWRAVSGDLSRQIDRNRLPVMDRVWSIDAVAKNASTSYYGNCVSLSESPLKEGLIYVGTDDGLVQVTENGGATWRAVAKFPGVPETTYVSRLEASRHLVNRVYAAFENHKRGDFSPYLLRSDDAGKTWVSVRGDLPAQEPVYALQEDHLNPDLLFAGTEYGLYFTVNGGRQWVRLKGGLPTIAVRDIAIQPQASDLVLGTFGRGFFILDNYGPLRSVTPALLASPAHLFPVADALMFIPSKPYGSSGKGMQGEAFYVAENPPVAATFTYYLKEPLRTLREERREREKELVKQGKPVPYPSPEALRAEDEEEPPSIILTVRNESGDVVRRVAGPAGKGIHRAHWNLRYPSANPPQAGQEGSSEPSGHLAMPGVYTVTLSQRVRGMETILGTPQRFNAVTLGMSSLPAPDRAALLEFQRTVADLQRAVVGSARMMDEVKARLALLRTAARETPAAVPGVDTALRAIEVKWFVMNRELRGDASLRSRNEPVPPSILQRVEDIAGDLWSVSSAPTVTMKQGYAVAAEEFAPLLAGLRALVEVDLKEVESKLEKAGAPWTPGRIPEWTPR